MDPAYGHANIIPGITFVVDTITGRTARVEKLLHNAVQVTVKQRGYELENWPWSWLTMRQPRRIKRYPRPFRFPRDEKTDCCHCKIGKMEVKYEKEAPFINVICLRCKLPIGTESFPRRVERAFELVRKAGPPPKPTSKILKVVPGTKRKVSRSGQSTRKKRNSSPRKLVVRRPRRSDAKKSNPKTARKKVSKVSKPVSKSKGGTRKISKGSNPSLPEIVQRQVEVAPVTEITLIEITENVSSPNSTEEVSPVNQMDSVESLPKSDSSADVRGPGSGGTADSGEMLSGVSGGADQVREVLQESVVQQTEEPVPGGIPSEETGSGSPPRPSRRIRKLKGHVSGENAAKV